MKGKTVLGWGWPSDPRHPSHLIIEESRGGFLFGVTACGTGRGSGQVQSKPIDGYRQCLLCLKLATKGA